VTLPAAPRVLHAALALSAILIIGVMVALARMSPATAAHLTPVLRAATGIEILTVAIVMRVVASPMEALRAGEDAAAWWLAQAPRAIVLWALAEATVAVGAVFWFLSRDLLVLIALGGFGLGALAWARPGRLIST
jgi:hypothetical protein